MNQQEALNYITLALKRALKRDRVEFAAETDLIGEKILDSLEGIVFIMELTELTGKEFPEDIDLIKVGLLKVLNLIDYLTGAKNISDFLITSRHSSD
jgi:acyl carrier protein